MYLAQVYYPIAERHAVFPIATGSKLPFYHRFSKIITESRSFFTVILVSVKLIITCFMRSGLKCSRYLPISMKHSWTSWF